jgi:cyclohexanecarboxylate-CoA ligase
VSTGWTLPVTIPVDDLWDLVEWRCARTPDATFLSSAHGPSLTFSEYRHASVEVAAALAAEGTSPGAVVAWQLPTEMEAAILIGACSWLRIIQVPLLTSYRQRELEAVARQTHPDLLVVPRTWREYDHAALADHVRTAEPRTSILVVDGNLPVAHPGTRSRPPAPSGVTTQWVFYTSGTTAEPKGVRHRDSTVIAAAIGTSEASLQTQEDVYLLVTPIAHVGGVIALCSGLITGCRSVLVPRYEPADLVELVEQHGITLAAAPLTVQRAFLDAHRNEPQRRRFASVRAFPIGGAPKPPELHWQIRREIGGTGLLSGYGMTECPIATKNRVGDPDEKLAATEGRPTRGVDVRVVPLGAPSPEGDGPDGDGPDRDGEVRVRGPQLFAGYVDQSLDEAAFDDEGYFRTGDLGRLDADGFLVVTGRLKDIIIRKGENISAAEVEHLLRRHPVVSDVAVIGLPDPDTGESCCAVVEVSDPGASLSLADVTAFLEEQGLMRQKLPERLDIVSALPRNAFGKPDKKALRTVLSHM